MIPPVIAATQIFRTFERFLLDSFGLCLSLSKLLLSALTVLGIVLDLSFLVFLFLVLIPRVSKDGQVVGGTGSGQAY